MNDAESLAADSPPSDRLTMPGYQPRVIEDQIAEALARVGAVLIDGARACGKTWTARRFARSEARIDDPASQLLIETAPESLLAGDSPRLLDEWQMAPSLWNRVRRACDDRSRPGQFILTGSASPSDEITRHSGMGRIARIRMRPMSLYESGLSDGSASLQSMFDGDAAAAVPRDNVSLVDVVDAICVGGWPANVGASAGPRGEAAGISGAIGDYINEAARVEVAEAVGVRHQPEALLRLMRSVARNVATEARLTGLAADAGGDSALASATVRSYLSALERIFVVERQPAWSVELRSRASLRKSPKLHFVDPSLAASLLRATPARLMADTPALGSLFESLVVRDLRILSQGVGADVYHYRDNVGLEADAVIERSDGAWIGVQAKLSPGRSAVDAAAASLLRLRDKVARRRDADMAALLVVTSTGAAYRRTDGVIVTPVTSLGP
ncbi:ATP-binding protein [Candidatus Poriferisodalis sp.]|uniref:ATP-binding protein n=1 Tax=Candidatus Poriferisodalis sp. TaxID=3101277 RepID=UPI003B01D88C